MKSLLRKIFNGILGACAMFQFRIQAHAAAVPGEIVFLEDGFASAWEEFRLLLSVVWKDAAALAAAFLCMTCMIWAAGRQKKSNR